MPSGLQSMCNLELWDWNGQALRHCWTLFKRSRVWDLVSREGGRIVRGKARGECLGKNAALQHLSCRAGLYHIMTLAKVLETTDPFISSPIVGSRYLHPSLLDRMDHHRKRPLNYLALSHSVPRFPNLFLDRLQSSGYRQLSFFLPLLLVRL